ncbi:MAG: UDP-glucose 4-epimerase GalE [Acidobacteria bacterium RIFCSPLOWO2_12_FULL_60_22]|nr:MAG: UDP-glucose 4-epimerase GalE [Acidobacteria bacterium RIFCSPLOWO2_12_FULL_60_22]
MQILVAGGAGYIGSHVAWQLVQRGHEVIVYDDLSTGHRFLVDGLPCVVANIADPEKLAGALRGVSAVMHFADRSQATESVEDPKKYFENNLQGGLQLLHAVLQQGTPYFVYSSSCAVYGLPREVPIVEEAPRIPITPYGASKLAFEHFLEAYSKAYGLRFVSLRYFNAAGADEGGTIGELHQPETHLIPRALEVAAGLRKELEIYGTDYPTADGTGVRDYVHVCDLAEGHLRALEYLVGGGQPTAFNLGTGTGSSILTVLATVEEVTGHPIRKRFCPRRPGDPPVLVADAQRARDTLCWKPSRSLREMVASAWNWMGSIPQAAAPEQWKRENRPA